MDGLVTINTPLKESIRSNQFVGRKGKDDSFSQSALFRLADIPFYEPISRRKSMASD